MAQPRGPAGRPPRASSDVPMRLRTAPPLRSSSADAGVLDRYRGTYAKGANVRESFPSAGMLPAVGSARRRGALRELLGQQGATLAQGPSEESAQEPPAPPPPAPPALGGSQGSGLCMEPREHAWMLAAAEGRFEVLRELLEAEPGLLLRSDPITGYTVLHWLAKHGRHEELILVHDFAKRHGLRLDMSVPGSGGLTPLHLATQQGHDMVIKVLVGALGADPTRRDHSGHRACHYLRPNAPRHLRELAGAEEWEVVDGQQCGNSNNNSSGTWLLRRSASNLGSKAGNSTKKAAAAKEKDSGSTRVAQIHGLLRQAFPFFQDR
ncbi:ankyrin repeat domain-containing protein SOWAHD [Echinops telfairi]|uniref:Ankyrin repeat domain-containing protein SOWAHD n=1 Tax=Echinops telfairi TaxID=9371 RepID=A0ABM0IXL9_ECHTE|nr:ankyrin repeat domain-containing protein SOWAHD [Echinops telfairi]